MDSLVLGTPFDLRMTMPTMNEHVNANESVGCFSSILPVRTIVEDDDRISAFFKTLMGNTLESFDHPDVPWRELLEVIRPKRLTPGTNPLFTTCFSYLPKYENYSLPMTEAAFDYWLALGKSKGGSVKGMLTYDAHIFSRRTAKLACDLLLKVIAVLQDIEWNESIHSLKTSVMVSEKAKPMKIPIEKAGTALTHPWDSLIASALEEPTKLAVVDGERTFTYDAFHNRCSRLAASLQQAGAGRGSRLGVLLPNTHETIEIHFATAWLGATVVNLNTHLVANELAYIMRDAEVEVLIVHADLLDGAVQALSALQEDGSALIVEHVVVVRGEDRSIDLAVLPGVPCSHYERGLDAIDITPSTALLFNQSIHCDAASPYQMYYTSGTTGKPKGVILSMDIVCRHATGTIDAMRINGADVWGHFAPMFHLVDAFAIYAVTHVRGRHVILETFEASRALEAIEREGVTVSNLASTMVNLMASSPAVGLRDYSSLRIMSCGGSPLSPSVVRRVISTFACEFFLSYGMTECCGKISMSILSEAAKRDLGVARQVELICTSGAPFALMDVKVVTDGGSAAEPGSGDVGEVLCRGPTVFGEYWNRPEATRESFADGWFRTGDLATVDASGYITVVDRCKDMILCGGENVYCVEVESALHQHPSVQQASVFGIPNAVMGEMVAAAVTLRAGHAAVSSRDLVRHCQGLLSSYKVPYTIRIVESMPTTGSGKILKTALREMMASGPRSSSPRGSRNDADGSSVHASSFAVEVVDARNLASLDGIAVDSGCDLIVVECASEQEFLSALSVSLGCDGPLIFYVAMDPDRIDRVLEDQMPSSYEDLVVVSVQPDDVMDDVSQAIAAAAAFGVSLPQEENTEAKNVDELGGRQTHAVPESSTLGVSAPDLESLIIGELSEMTGVDVGLDDALVEKGVSSSVAIELSSRLSASLNVDLPATLLFDYSNVAAISRKIRSLMHPNDRAAAGRKEVDSNSYANSNSNKARDQEVALRVQRAAESILGCSVAPDQPFADAGLTSSAAISLMDSLQDDLGMELSLTATFDYPTVDSLISYIREEITSKAGDVDGGMHAVARAVDLDASQGRIRSVGLASCASRLPCSNLATSFDAVTPVPVSRWDATQRIAESNGVSPQFGSFLSGLESFDQAPFMIATNEARFVDPQQKLLLETTLVAWQSSDAASVATKSSGGVFVGISMLEYPRLAARHNGLHTFTATSGHLSVSSGRVSYTFGLQGPSVTVDTACSSSLVALSMGSDYVRGQEDGCANALVGGANATIAREWTEACALAGMLSPEGRCKTLDNAADGYVRAEACVTFHIAEAEAIGVEATLVNACKVNQDGRSSSLTAPNGPSQQDVMQRVLREGQCLPEDVSILQMHGTGTALGDPIEIGVA